MITIAMQDRDLLFENGDFKLTENEFEVSQCVEIDLGINQGDWFLNLLKGTDHSLILEKSSDAMARAEVYRVLGNEDRIDTINNVEVVSDRKRRVRSIYFDVTLVDGTELEKEVVLDVGS